jgi:hypothetical protein
MLDRVATLLKADQFTRSLLALASFWATLIYGSVNIISVARDTFSTDF